MTRRTSLLTTVSGTQTRRRADSPAQMNGVVTVPPPPSSKQRESGESKGHNNTAQSRVAVQLALRTLRGIQQRYEAERAACAHMRLYSIHVALDDSDMVWLATTIEELEKSLAERSH